MAGTFPLVNLIDLGRRKAIWPVTTQRAQAGNRVSTLWATAPRYRWQGGFQGLRKDTVWTTWACNIVTGGTGASVTLTGGQGANFRIGDVITRGAASQPVTAVAGDTLTLAASATWTAGAATGSRDEVQAVLGFIEQQKGTWDSFQWWDKVDAVYRTATFADDPEVEEWAGGFWSASFTVESVV